MIKKEIKQLTFTAGEYRDIECAIPSTVCSVLREQGMINGTALDIAELSQEGKLFSACQFKADIEFTKAEASKRFIYLRISGLISKSEIIFNDRSYGIVTNVNRVAVLNIKDGVREGKNTLVIESTEVKGRSYHILNSGEMSREYETAPNVCDAGILGEIEVLASETPIITAVRTSQVHEDGKVNLIVDYDMLGEAENIRAVASLVSPSGKIYFGGAFEGKIRISVPDPELWWPNGFGTQGLYKLAVTVYQGGEAKDTYEKKIGLRKVELLNSALGVPQIYVNGTKIFALGATYIHEDAFMANRNKKETEKLIKIAAEANMNTLAVFDEGFLPSEDFYELCDKYGMMVWQSLSVPYIAPPAAGVFAAGLYDAIDDEIDRLSSHPSVVLTFLAITRERSYSMRLYPDAIEEFRNVCMTIIDPALKKINNSVFVSNAEELFKYDERYIDSEGGRLSSSLYTVPAEATLAKFLGEDDHNIFSKAAEMHTASREGCLKMIGDMAGEMKFPTGMPELIYASGLASGILLSRSILRARCEKNEMCSSAVLRQLNDGYYAISSSLVDYTKSKKPITEKLYGIYDQIVVNTVPCENTMKVYVKNDSKKPCVGKLLFALYDTNNKCWFENTMNVFLEPASLSLIAEQDFAKYLTGAPENYYVYYELFGEKGVTIRGTNLFVPIKHFNFKDPKINAEISGMGCKFTLTLKSASYVTGAYIGFEGVNAVFDSNYVDIIHGTPTVVTFETDSAISPEELTSRLKITTPYSFGK